jgi:protein TonB
MPPQDLDNTDPNAPTINIPPPTVASSVDIGGPGGMNIAEGDYLPIVRVAPVYPARALSRGIEGYVDMSFTVTSTGTVRDPIVVFSTSSLFDRAATRAVLKFKYKPRVVDGVPVEVPGVKTRITFKIEE